MNPRPRDVAISYGASGILHAGAIAAMFAAAVPLSVNVESTVIDTAVPRASTVPKPDQVRGLEVETKAADSPRDLRTEVAGGGIDALANVDVADSRLAAFARQKLQQARNSSARKTVAEQMADLESLGRRLNEASSAEGVTAVAEAIAPWIGSGPRATEPSADVDDSQPFDPTTAQIIEVQRSGEEGSFEYVALMLDAAGRTQQVPLDEADGRELYDLFQLMKKFPLLETVYRKAALGLLDKLVAEERTPATAMPESSAESQQPGTDESHHQQN